MFPRIFIFLVLFEYLFFHVFRIC
uniref:Uncharacterized protein n=1 Tax=Rhizophora mucronata TaxID=61149 RepID=A0A2P2QVN9_RHIMU